MTTLAHTEVKGTVVQIMGAVVDIEFAADSLPDIYDELRMRHPLSGEDLSFEVEQHLGNNWVRCIAMGPTEGLQRGQQVTALGRPISVPVERRAPCPSVQGCSSPARTGGGFRHPDRAPLCMPTARRPRTRPNR